MRLFRDITEAAREGDAVLENIFAVEANFTVAWFDQSDQHLDGRTLARAVGTEISEDLPRANCEAYILDRWNAAVPFGGMPNFQHDAGDRHRSGSISSTRVCA